MLMSSALKIYASDMGFYNADDTYGITIREPSSICKDDDGFMWVATKSGIYRLSDESKCYNVPYTTVNIVSVELVHRKGELYVFTNHGEIFRYNKRLDRFEHYLDLLSALNVEAIYLADIKIGGDKDILWLATSAGLYHCVNGKCTRIPGVEGAVGDMTMDGCKHLIVASTGGVYRINTENYDREVWNDNPGVFPTLIKLDKAMNRLWIGTMSDGLYYLDCDTKELKASPIKRFPHQYVRDIEIVSDSAIWCGIDGRGIWQLSRDGSRVTEIFQEDKDNPHSIAGNGVLDMCYDRPDRVWVCSFTGGVSIAELNSPLITHFRHRVNDPNSPANDYIYDVAEDSKGRIWIGTNGGLSYWNPDTGKWVNRFGHEYESFIVRSVCEDSKGDIWVGTYSNGVYVLDGNTQRIKAHHTDRQGILSKNGFVFDILRDSNGDIWMAGMIGAIIKYDHVTGQFDEYPVRPVSTMAELDDSTLIMASNNQLLSLDKNTKEIKELLTDNMIQDIEVTEGKIWVASNGNGLICYDIASQATETFNLKHGSVSDNINSILYHNGNLWLGTDNGLYRFNIGDKSVASFDFPETAGKIDYTSDASVKLSNGTSAWGTSEGLIILDTESMTSRTPSGRIYLQDILLSSRSMRDMPDILPEMPLDEITDLTLQHDQNNITFSLQPLGSHSRTSLFSWKMEGFDDDWSELSDLSIINYTNLNPGNYTLYIRLYNPDLISERKISIHIKPPFWATWWFKTAYVLLIATLLYLLLRFYINRINRRHAEHKLQFFINTAHDLRTALTLIKAPIEEIKRSPNINEEEKQYLQLAIDQMQRLTMVTTQLMDLQKIDLGKGQFHPMNYDIVPLISSRISMFESIAEKRNITLTYSYKPESYVTAVDAGKIERIVDNLLSNAIKYSHEYSSVDINFTANDNEWRLSIVDHGIGIDKKSLDNLFKEFFRSENAVNSRISGSGIGLALTKKLVELHDGKIIVESREDEGSRFEIVIPHRLCDSAPLPVNAEEPESADKSIDNEEIKNMRILVCEDNDDLRRFMKRPLGRHFNVATSSNGVDAWEYIKKELPDLIVSDIMMPGMDGFELCRLVKSTFETSHIPIILLSALSDQSDELHGLGLGADDYMTKPFDMKTLTQRIMSIILNRRALGSRVISEVGETVEEADTKESNELNDAFVRQALKIVVNHLEDSDFSKEEFAREMGVSTSLLFKKIKALTDMTVVDFIRSIRMDHAMKLLNDRQYSIGEIAYKCGFSSISYFSTVFKKHFGKSPTDFRA